jgi:hypothetical protein
MTLLDSALLSVKEDDGLGMVVCAGGGGRSVEWILALLNKYMAHGEKKHGRAKKTFTKLSNQDGTRAEIQEWSIQKKSSRMGCSSGQDTGV